MIISKQSRKRRHRFRGEDQLGRENCNLLCSFLLNDGKLWFFLLCVPVLQFLFFLFLSFLQSFFTKLCSLVHLHWELHQLRGYCFKLSINYVFLYQKTEIDRKSIIREITHANKSHTRIQHFIENKLNYECYFLLHYS